MTVKSHDLAHIRSVVLAGHAGSGKTTLAEQVLFRAGAIPRQGRVDDGTAHLDYEPEEQKRHQSLSLAVGTFEHGEHEITVVDTPGYPDFTAEMIEGFHAADAALFVMDASGGVEAGLEAAVGVGRATNTAACFVLNKCDRENADPSAALDALREAFGTKIAPLHIAIGAADTFSGYIDLVHRKAWKFEGGKEVEIPVPDELAGEVARRRDQLLEAAAEADDVVFEKYLGEEEISDAELDACLHKGVRESILAPVLVASAAKGIGLSSLLDAIVRYLPSPEEEGPYAATDKAGKDLEVPASGSQLLVRVFKTSADPFVGRLTYLRVLSGTLKSQGTVFNSDKGEDERIGQLLYLHGKEQEPAAELRAGEIGAVAKLGVTETGDTITTRDAALHLGADRLPRPHAPGRDRAGVQGRPRQDGPGPAADARGGADRARRAQRHRRADPAGDRRRARRGHHRAAEAQVRRRDRHPTPTVPYRETIRGKTQVHGRYKKQTGGHGMFGDVWLELEPSPGAGVEFAEKVVGGSVPRGFFAGVEKGIRETAAEGVFAGYPLIDFKATLYDGSFHPVDSNELSFKIAASMALKDGVLAGEAGPARADHGRRGQASPSSTWARSTATSTGGAAACWASTRRTGCR